MRVKRFIGSSMQEAVAKMKAEFGPEAVILHTKKTRVPGLRGLFSRPRIEIIAALDDPKPKRTQNAVNFVNRAPVERNAVNRSLNAGIYDFRGNLNPGRSAPEVDTDISVLFHKADIHSLPEKLREIAIRLKEADVEERIAVSIAKSLMTEGENLTGKDRLLEQRLHRRVRSIVKVVPPWDFANGPEIVCLIGPTGVGKTTTIAKLAANFALLSDRKVSLITLDTYRIAAVEQLRTYADIINVPLDVVFTPEELRAKVVERAKCSDLVLIDTAGRSPRNAMQMAELKAFLEGVPLTETHLVISACTRYTDLVEIISKFSPLNPDYLIVTKLDETTVYGSILNAYALARKPIAYLTDGQNVPENIEAADADRIAGLILGRDT